ncbi:exopolysaccharide production repressor exox [Mesorhizobium sp. SARCC-RB16n]|uniref:exopolysaccharide production repressor protein n=1 Tax=Mesorhizobium sp. SARCC-RB16n TaxID=2116687 RepID=UPI00122EC809|nr:exopolysaccharide production repressor exox [Mesorhizobium sp. SARCC-RB16n]
MEASHFLIHVIGASVASALLTYCLTSSLVQTALCAVLAQVGYFLAMLCLVWRTEQRSTRRSRPHTTEAERLSEVSDDHSGKAE